MRLLVQRVLKAEVKVGGSSVGYISKGALVFFGVKKEDKAESTLFLANKLVNLRIFSDADDKMNLSLKDVKGGVLIISQFTLYADCTSGRRPSFDLAADPRNAKILYDKFISEVKSEVSEIATGIFGAKMEVSLVNDGPGTFLIEI